MSTSNPLPSVQWFSPQGDLISNSSHLEIMNIQREKRGIYTCIATQIDSGATMNSTMNVIILCECMLLLSRYALDIIGLYIHSYRCSNKMFLRANFLLGICDGSSGSYFNDTCDTAGCYYYGDMLELFSSENQYFSTQEW